jgi:hypothetical protein|tara:strand:+ start:565 stop:915 length:351 start_codon:yes stop_codon:yes gene_type:complete
MKTCFAALTLLVVLTGWTAKAGDSVCGLANSKIVSNPAIVNWDLAINQTPSMKTLVKQKIKKTSPRGIILLQKAEDKVIKCSTEVMNDDGYDSVWKAIKHKQKKAPDITQKIIAKY